MAFVEVVPVHFVDSHSKNLFKCRVDSFLDDAIIKALVDVDSCGVSIVEDEGMPEGFSLNIVGLIVSNDLEELFVEGIGLKEISFDGFSEGRMILNENGF